MLRKSLLVAAGFAALTLAGCGGSSSPGSGSGQQPQSVAGPLDPVQTTLTQSVFGPLENATQGTPLQGVLVCADKSVNGNLLNVVDALLAGLQNPSTLASQTPAQVQAQLKSLTGNLEGLLLSLANQGSCGGALTGSPGSNPLAGTPLAPLGDALLPVLQQVQGQLGSGPLSLAMLSSLFTQIQGALQLGLQQLPPSVTSAPVLGGVLSTLNTSLGNIASLINTVGQDPANAPAAVKTTLQNLLNGITTQIVPLAFLQQSGGGSGPLSQVQAAIQSLAAQVQSALGGGGGNLGNLFTSGNLSPIVAPVQQLVQQIVQPLKNALAGAGGSGNPVSNLLNTVLPALTNVLTGLLGGAGGGGGTCLFANLPLLSGLCAVLP
jgi:hypothetical protein